MIIQPRAILEGLFAIAAISLVSICVTIVESDVIVIGTIRLLIAMSGFWLYLYCKRALTTISGAQWGVLILIGLLFGTHWITFFLSIKISTPSIAAIGISTYGIHLIMLHWFFNGRKPSLNNWIALLLAISGSLIAIPEFSLANSHTVGLLIGILSGFTYAGIPLIHQRHRTLSNGMRTLGQFCFALLLFLLLAPWGNWQIPATDWPYLIFMGTVCTLIGHALWVRSSTHLPIQITSTLFYMGLPFTLLFEFTLLDKTISSSTLIGALLVIMANLLNIDWRNRPTQS